MKQLLGFLAAFAASMLFVAAPTGSVFAAETPSPTTNESITLSPVNDRFSADAGQSHAGELTIVNDGATAYDFTVYARPYWVSNESYDPVFTKESVQSDAYQWVRLPQTQFRAEAGQTVKIPYTIDIPATAAPGGHYGVIFAETQPAKSDTQGANSVDRKKRVGMIIYASVNGQVINKGDAVTNNIPFWQIQPPMHASVTAKNDGNVDFINKVTFSAKDVFGNPKYTIVKEYPVLPQTTRNIELEWQESPWFGLFRVDITQEFLDTKLSTSNYVLMMPRLLPIMLLLLVAVGGAYALLRRRKK